MTTKGFIEKIKEAIDKLKIDDDIDKDLLSSLTIAQAIIESNWGNSAPGNMLFGMKWTEGCGYEWQELWTSEYVNGKYIDVKAKFRKYDSWEDSIKDHGKLLSSKRYIPVRKCKDYICATEQIKACGYATSPSYTQTLRKIIEYYKLYEMDWKMDFNKQLTTNFKWGEFWSNSRSGIKIEPPENMFDNIKLIAEELQIIRDLINKPIKIISGYRTPEWNKHEDGSTDSFHMKGMAADTRAVGMNIIKYALYVLRFTTKFKGIGLYRDLNFVHTDLRSDFTIFQY